MIQVSKPEGNMLPIGRLGCKWEDIIKMDLRKIGFDDVDWIRLAQNWGQLWTIENIILKIQVL